MSTLELFPFVSRALQLMRTSDIKQEASDLTNLFRKAVRSGQSVHLVLLEGLHVRPVRMPILDR